MLDGQKLETGGVIEASLQKIQELTHKWSQQIKSLDVIFFLQQNDQYASCCCWTKKFHNVQDTLNMLMYP
jgi:hypothetical protein